MTEKTELTFDFPTDQETWQRWFALDINRPESWLFSARDLMEQMGHTATRLQEDWIRCTESASAEPQAPPHGAHRTYLFIAAIAIENLLKAILVKKSEWPDSKVAEALPNELRSHKLLDLAEMVNLPLTDNESELLERLTEFGIWLGRYPAPTTLNHTKPKKLKSGIVNVAGFMYGSDIRNVEIFANKLLDSLVGVRGIELVARFPERLTNAFENATMSPSIRAW